MLQKSLKIENNQGLELAADLRLPADGEISAMAVFAHCFTCNKNFNAIRNISHSLTQHNIGVLSFDFTGLGSSEGDFSDTNFSTNISDLIETAGYLEQHYQAPQILIGHSLGGAAVILAASKLPSVKAVATIGAPADVPHVTHLFQEDLEEIKASGQAKVSIGGRPFTIKRQFLDDLEQNPLDEVLGKLKKALLVMHSPQDNIVGIDNAAALYTGAKHPKSFITLDGADHLLTKKQDSAYAGHIIATWASRYIDAAEVHRDISESQVFTQTGSEGLLTDILTGRHQLIADEPESVGGTDLGPTPYDYLLAALGACTGMTLRLYADRKKWPLKQVKVHLDHEKRHVDDCRKCEDPKSRIDHIEKVIELEGDLDQTQKERLLEISAKCPVHRTLDSEIRINSLIKNH